MLLTLIQYDKKFRWLNEAFFISCTNRTCLHRSITDRIYIIKNYLKVITRKYALNMFVGRGTKLVYSTAVSKVVHTNYLLPSKPVRLVSITREDSASIISTNQGESIVYSRQCPFCNSGTLYTTHIASEIDLPWHVQTPQVCLHTDGFLFSRSWHYGFYLLWHYYLKWLCAHWHNLLFSTT